MKQTDILSLLTEKPASMNRLGNDCFAEMEAYRLNKSDAETVFINNDFLNSDNPEKANPGDLTTAVEASFFLTLDKERSNGEDPIKVFADRQADPMNMSLNGNLGSGRAVYLGRCFNLKGIGRTVLATSVDPNHSNGHLDLVSALWEAICANVIYTNLKTGSAPVLAVIDTRKKISVPWREGLYPGGFIVRVDMSGELDRPTHLFYRNQPVSARQIREFACNLGRQDAEKFIERILHGCWSAGNVSTAGHMIDYDTVFALRSRAPQWSYRPNWLSNFFGLEGDGQKKLLKAIINHQINHERLGCREAYRAFDETRRNHLRTRFYDLLGMNSDKPFVSRQVSQNEFSEMVMLFEELSMKMSANLKATAPWDEDNSCLNIFDFSNFLRFAPILIDSGEFDEKRGLELLRNSAAKIIESKVNGMPQSIEETILRKFVVSSQEQLQKLENNAGRFIEIYLKLMNEYRNSLPESWKALIFKAFIVNEERTYMNCRPGNDTLVVLVQKLQEGALKPEEFSVRIQTIIMACDRTLKKRIAGRFLSNIRIYLDGFTALLPDENGLFQPAIAIFNQNPVQEISDNWKISINGRLHNCFMQINDQFTCIIGPQMPLSDLCGKFSPENAVFLKNGEKFCLTSITREKKTTDNLN